MPLCPCYHSGIVLCYHSPVIPLYFKIHHPRFLYKKNFKKVFSNRVLALCVKEDWSMMLSSVVKHPSGPGLVMVVS